MSNTPLRQHGACTLLIMTSLAALAVPAVGIFSAVPASATPPTSATCQSSALTKNWSAGVQVIDSGAGRIIDRVPCP